jgi:hypothetical protein
MASSSPSPQQTEGVWRWFGDQLRRFFTHPLNFLWRKLRNLAVFIWRFLKALADLIYRMITAVPRRVWIGTGITVGAIAFLAVSAFALTMWYIDRQIAPAAKIDQVTYLGQGWGIAPNSPDRQTYYYTAQGTYVADLRYDWLVNLERPWSKKKFASPEFMRAYGFIEDDADLDKNPGHLPVGFAPRYDPTYGEMMLDLTCPPSHTGELQYVKNGTRYSVRVDGGSGAADVKGMHAGHFAMDLFASLSATYLNPFKFSRFAETVLGKHNTSEARELLHRNLGTVLKKQIKQAWIEKKLHVYPVEEGYGRTDGLGRILNTAFAVNLTEKNYRTADAPVSYPPVWDIYKFDWVQYTGSVRQPMARNLGEAMGVGARYYLVDPYGRPLPNSERYEASTQLANMNKIEEGLRKLTPPCWPEDVFGKIDVKLATEGRDLFAQRCVGCHGPYIGNQYQVEADAPWKLKDYPNENPRLKADPAKFEKNPLELKEDVPHWVMSMLPVEDIGTDPTSALNFVRYRLNLTSTGLSADEVRHAMLHYYQQSYDRQVQYNWELWHDPLIAKEQQDSAHKLYDHLVAEKEEGYIREQLGGVELSSVPLGAALNYIIRMVRDQAYEDMGFADDSAERHSWDGFWQLDIPQAAPQYKARPLAGIWATPPFLHNGSVPTLYQMLVPAYERSKKFYRHTTLFDPYAVGLQSDASEKGAFLYDTSVTGNSNQGHEFRAGYQPWAPGAPPSYGVIGPELTEHQRWAIVEYLKVHRDDPNDHSCSVYIPPPPPRCRPSSTRCKLP